MHRQFRRWTASGRWDVLLQALADAGGDAEALQMIDSTTVRAHHCAPGARAAERRDLGRSRGGFSTKIHLRANAEGLPIGVALTPGQAHDRTAYDDLMAERDSDPGVLLADRGCDNERHHPPGCTRQRRYAGDPDQAQPQGPALSRSPPLRPAQPD